MKTILREWSKNKTACFLLLIYLASKIIYLTINARIVVVLATTLEDYQNVWCYLPEIGLLFSGLILTGAISQFGIEFSHRIYTTMNNSFLDKVLEADYEFFTKLSCSKLSTTYSDLWQVGNSGKIVANLVVDIFSIGVNIMSIYLIYPSLVIPILFVYGALMILCAILFQIYEKFDSKANSIKNVRNQEFHEVIDGFGEVRSFCTQRHHSDSIKEANKGIRKILHSRCYLDAGIEVVIEGLCAVGTIITILMVVKDMGSGIVTQAIAMSLVMYVWRLTNPILGILDKFGSLSELLIIIKRYDEVMDYQNEPSKESVNLDSFNECIEVKELSFQYNDSDTILKNINMRIKKGQKIGICGSSGGGKSTLIKLLEKFYNPTEGSINIDGIDTRVLTADSVRRKMGIVHQDHHIFSATIYENIVYGNWECSEYDVIEACKKANLYDFIQSLPDKFQTEVGPKGLKLSGGQKQRIALARIFLSDPEIVLLDEATSALDNESEAIIQDALNLFKNKTVITIAHRLSTIKDSDQIYVIENHRVVEEGTHDELINLQGRYYELYEFGKKNNK